MSNVVSFPDASIKHQVSTGGGLAPRWTKQGDLYYWHNDALLKVRVKTKPAFNVTRVETVLSDGRMNRANLTNFPGYDINPDSGAVFLMLESTERAPKRLHVVQNWLAQFPSLNNHVR